MVQMNDQQKEEYSQMMKENAEMMERIKELYERRIKREKQIAEVEADIKRLKSENSLKDKLITELQQRIEDQQKTIDDQQKQWMKEKQSWMKEKEQMVEKIEAAQQEAEDERKLRQAAENKANELEAKVAEQKQQLESLALSSTVSFAELQEHHEWQLDEARRDVMMEQQHYLDTVAEMRQLKANLECFVCLHHEMLLWLFWHFLKFYLILHLFLQFFFFINFLFYRTGGKCVRQQIDQSSQTDDALSHSAMVSRRSSSYGTQTDYPLSHSPIISRCSSSNGTQTEEPLLRSSSSTGGLDCFLCFVVVFGIFLLIALCLALLEHVFILHISFPLHYIRGPPPF